MIATFRNFFFEAISIADQYPCSENDAKSLDINVLSFRYNHAERACVLFFFFSVHLIIVT